MTDPVLPFLDEHDVLVAASPDTTWDALVEHVAGTSRSPAALAALALGAQPHRPVGTPSSVGAAVPGFAVTEAVRGSRLALAGRHRFSTYALVFTLAPHPLGTRLAAASWADFPRRRGRAYRALVVGTGGHRVAVHRILTAVRRRAERAATTGPVAASG